MSEENLSSGGEVLKSVNDRVSELEDLQLVNKLDIINMKNELDRISLSSGPSPEAMKSITELEKLAKKSESLKNVESVRKDIDNIRSQLEKMKTSAPAPSAGKSEIDSIANEINVLKAKLEGMEGKVSAAKTELPPEVSEIPELKKEIPEIRRELVELRQLSGPSPEQKEMHERLESRIQNLEKTVSGISIPEKQVSPEEVEKLNQRISELESSSTDLPAAMKSEIENLSEKMQAIEARKEQPSVPADVMEKLNDVDELESEIGAMKATLETQNSKLSGIEGRAGTSVDPEMKKKIESMESSIKEIENLKSEMLAGKSSIEELREQVKKSPGKGAAPKIPAKIEEIEKRLDAMESSASGKSDAAESPPEDLRNALDELKSSFEAQKKEMEKLKTGKSKGSPKKDSGEDELVNEINILKAKIESLEKNPPGAKLPQKELDKLKGGSQKPSPVMLKRIEDIEKNMENVRKLASGLRPIELPGKKGDGKKVSGELESRLKSLERMIGKGVGAERFDQLENKFDEIKDKLPQKIDEEVKKKLDASSKETDRKLKELDNLKREMVESTIEQLLAQPEAVSKLVGSKLNDKVSEFGKKLKKLDEKVSPADAKVNAMVRESEKTKIGLEEIKKTARDIQEGLKSHKAETETEMKTMNTRLDSLSTSVKQLETLGVTGITRDLEILKTKSDWLESVVSKMDLKDVYDKISEVEERVRSSNTEGPIIIE